MHDSHLQRRVSGVCDGLRAVFSAVGDAEDVEDAGLAAEMGETGEGVDALAGEAGDAGPSRVILSFGELAAETGGEMTPLLKLMDLKWVLMEAESSCDGR